MSRVFFFPSVDVTATWDGEEDDTFVQGRLGEQVHAPGPVWPTLGRPVLVST
jgi:hypothetical protein